MKITRIRIFKMDIARTDVFTIATMKLEKAENVLIGIETDDGLTGWGEASPFHALVGETQRIDLAVAQELRELLLGKNPLELADRIGEMDAFLPHNPTIKSAFDMALYDIAAQAAGMPLYQFLGGTRRPLETDFTISIGRVEEAGEKARQVVEKGFRIIKIKVGISDAEDYRRVEAIRQTVGDALRIRVDANQGWDRMQAVANLNRLAEFDIEFCEQPCRVADVQGLKYVSAHSPIPVMADESVFSPVDALRLVEQDVVPYFNIKLSKSGGLYRALQIAHIAEAGSRKCMVGCMSESRLGLTATAHLGAASPVFQFFDLDSFFEHAEDPVIGGVEVKDGFVLLPEEPGLGARPDEAFLKRCEEL